MGVAWNAWISCCTTTSSALRQYGSACSEHASSLHVSVGDTCLEPEQPPAAGSADALLSCARGP
eukprot:251433-Rhodomonas_salina.1